MGFKNGVIGVDIFFVLSGYLITGVLAQEYAKNGVISFKNFYMRRVLRLVPALWLLLAACMVWYVADPNVRHGLLGAIIAAATYIMNFNRIFYWMGSGPLDHTWSLAIEEQFYILWPITLILVPRRHWFGVALIIAALSIGWRFVLVFQGASVERIYNGTDCRIDPILLGCACGLLTVEARQSIRPILRYAFPIAALAICVLFLSPSVDGTLPLALFITAVGLLTPIVILGLDARMGGLIFTNRLTVLLGKCSYGIYLWHYPLLMFMTFYGFKGWWTLLNIPLTLAIAGASFVWLEQPVLKLKRYFIVTDGRFAVPQVPAGARH